MKILYSAGNRVGAGHQLSDFLDNLDSQHQVKVAAYADHIDNVRYVDWTLNALHSSSSDRNALANIFGFAAMPAVASKEAEILFEEIKDFAPDLVISDGEPIVGYIANNLGLPLWYCSGLHLMDGVEWQTGQLKGYSTPLEDTRRILRKLPPADRILIYSPFGDMAEPPKIRPEFEWTQPYHSTTVSARLGELALIALPDSNRINELSRLSVQIGVRSCLFKTWREKGYAPTLQICNWYFCTGHTRYVADALYNQKPICIAPSINDPETILNAVLVFHLKLGVDLGQVELMEGLAVDELEKAFNSKRQPQILTPKSKQLHERITEL